MINTFAALVAYQRSILSILSEDGIVTGTAYTDQRTAVIEIPEAVGVFDTFEDLQKAFYDLRMVGFSRHDISLLGKEDALKK